METRDFCMEMLKNYNERNLSNLLSFFSDDITFWGIGTDNFVEGLDDLKNLFIANWEKATQSIIYIQSLIAEEERENNLSWLTVKGKMVITIEEESRAFDNLRITILTERKGDDTKIIHLHASFPDFRGGDETLFGKILIH